MKKLNRISLNKFSNNELENRQKNALIGGQCCSVHFCGCCYDEASGGPYGGGGSTANQNHAANCPGYYSTC